MGGRNGAESGLTGTRPTGTARRGRGSAQGLRAGGLVLCLALASPFAVWARGDTAGTLSGEWQGIGGRVGALIEAQHALPETTLPDISTAEPGTSESDVSADQIARIVAAIRLDELLDLIAEEEILFGEDLRADMLPDLDPLRWQRQMHAQFSAESLRPVFEEAFARALKEVPDLTEIVTLSEAPALRKAMDLEVKARRLLLDPDVEEAAIAQADTAQGTPRHDALVAYIEAMDLIETNVAGSLNSNLTLYRALAQGGAFAFDVSEQEILSDVAGEAEALRAEIETWLTAYLFMAYHPLEDAEFADMVALGQSPSGRALFAAADKGYEAVFEFSSRALARLVVESLQGEDL